MGAMVGVGGKIVPVGNDRITFLHHFQHALFFVQQVIQPVGDEEPGNGPVIGFSPVVENIPDDRPNGSAGWLTGYINPVAGLGELFSKKFNLCAFPASVDSFKRNK